METLNLHSTYNADTKPSLRLVKVDSACYLLLLSLLLLLLLLRKWKNEDAKIPVTPSFVLGTHQTVFQKYKNKIKILLLLLLLFKDLYKTVLAQKQ